MYERCPHCGLKYEIEPGYFIGAMYVSYAIQIAIIVALSILTFYLGNDPDGWTYVLVIIPVTILLAPITFRFSRVLWLHYVAGIQYVKGL